MNIDAFGGIENTNTSLLFEIGKKFRNEYDMAKISMKKYKTEENESRKFLSEMMMDLVAIVLEKRKKNEKIENIISELEGFQRVANGMEKYTNISLFLNSVIQIEKVIEEEMGY